MNFLLPHRFKRVGLFIAPSGFLIWILMQKGYILKLAKYLFSTSTEQFYYSFNVACAIVSFFSFTIGMYFLSFSREKIEDEMIKKIRLDSFQLAAMVQLIILIAGFTSMIMWEPGEGGMMLFFIAAVLIFWLIYLLRFNYILHFRLR